MSAEHLLAEIAPILRVLTDPAGGDVTEATKSLHQLVVADPAKTLVLLAQIGAQGVGGFQSDARMIALISLNRLMFSSLEGLYLNKDYKVASTPWYAVPETMRKRIEDALCHGLKYEMDMKVRKSIALCAAKWTEESHARDYRPFRELPAIVISLTASTQTWHRFTAFQILANCPLLFFMCDKDNSVSSEEIASFILGGMTDSSVDTRVEAIKALSKMMLHDGDLMRGDTSCRDQLISQAFGCLTTIPWKARDTGLEHLAGLANEKPSLFMRLFDMIVGYLLAQMAPDPIDMYEFTTVKRDPDYDRFNWQDVGTQSSELLLALAEGYPYEFLKDHRQGTLKNIVGSYIGAQIAAFDRHVDQQEWSQQNPEDEEDYPAYPEEALTRLGETLPSASLLLVVTNHARGLLKNKDWRARYCCTMAITCIATGCPQFVDLNLLLAGMDQCRVDVDARVRHAWLELVYQLSLNDDGKMQKTRLNATVNACKPLLQDPCPRVRAQAARCLTGLLSPKFTQYSSNLKDREHLVDSLFTTFDTGAAFVQSEVLHTLSTLAELLGPQCKVLYKPWMGKLLGILGSDGDSKTLGIAIVNATTLVAAVGTEVSANDLAQLGPMMLRYHNSLDDTSDDWPILLFSWERLASTLEDAFAPMLPMIMPRIMKTASIPPGEDPDPYYCSEEGKSKAEALTALWFYASNVPTGFVQFLQPVWHLVLESLNIGFPAEVKKAAFNLVPLLLHQIKGSQQLSPAIHESIWKELMDAFTPIMKDETEYLAITACFVALREVIRVLHAPPPIDTASKIFKYAHMRAGEVQIVRQARDDDAKEYPDDPEDASDVEAEEEELLLDLERVCRTLKDFMRNVPEAQAAYMRIYDFIGDMLDGHWSA